MPTGVDSKHPAYVEALPDWEQLRDTHKGARAVKERGFRYLPPTASMRADGVERPEQEGSKAWNAYRTRAVFPDSMADAVETMLGVMHHKPAVIEVPPAMEPLLEKATLRNESMQALLRRINEEQLKMGRVGLLAEPVEGEDLPRIALYHAEDAINWDDGARDETEVDALNLVVLEESENERLRGFEWEHVEKFRVLVLGDPFENELVGDGTYRVGLVRKKGGDSKLTEEELVEPNIRGNTLDQIPFVFCNTADIVAAPDKAPLQGLSDLTLTIYRGEADYRQALFNQGQDTLVTIGAAKNQDGTPRRVGAGAEIPLPIGGDAKFIGVDSQGLAEMREALQFDYGRADSRAQALLEAVSRAAESGEALRVRVSARTASLNQIALTGAFALQELLRIVAKWLGLDPELVTVTPNTDFVADVLKGTELSQLMGAKMLGAPLSLEEIHAIIKERGLTDLTFEETIELMKKEAEEGFPNAPAFGVEDEESPTANGEQGDPNDPNDPFGQRGGNGDDDESETEEDDEEDTQ